LNGFSNLISISPSLIIQSSNLYGLLETCTTSTLGGNTFGGYGLSFLSELLLPPVELIPISGQGCSLHGFSSISFPKHGFPLYTLHNLCKYDFPPPHARVQSLQS
jgi:hypothetical protein